jgi:hypothetical protein
VFSDGWVIIVVKSVWLDLTYRWVWTCFDIVGVLVLSEGMIK